MLYSLTLKFLALRVNAWIPTATCMNLVTSLITLQGEVRL